MWGNRVKGSNKLKMFYIILLFNSMALTQQAIADSFTIADGEVINATQTLNDNETGTIEEGGELSVAGFGITAPGIDVVVDNAGSISTTGDYALGIISTGVNSSITNSGSISTTGLAGLGIVSAGANASIVHSGSISTTGFTGVGILSLGDNTAITHSGNISTSGDDAYGIWSLGDNFTITHSGSILTTGDYGVGIASERDNVSISSSGNISTEGDYAEGIRSFGDNDSITSSGSITTSGDYGYGITSTGDNASTTSSGSILTTGILGSGIFSLGDNTVITHNGSISTTGALGYGILSYGDNDSITSSGSISTTGNFGSGIWSLGDSVSITNSGSISTAGLSSGGIVSTGNTAIITNSGSISTIGNFSHGIYSLGANSTINNSGLISATGTIPTPISFAYRGAYYGAYYGAFLGASNSAAILGSSNDITLNLLPGSQIIGRIDLGDDGGDLDTVNVYGDGRPSSSTSLTFENTEVINLFGVNGVLAGSTVVTVDPTGESTRGVALAKTTSAIHNVISQRMAHTTPLAPSRVASLTPAPGMLFQERKPVAWAQAFGGESERDSEGSALEYEHDYRGVTLGYEKDYDGHRLGLMGGFVHAETETDIDSFETETDSYYLGAYGHINLGSVNLTTALIGGYSDSDNERVVWDNLNGREVAKSDLDGLFISPSVTLSTAYTVNNHLELRPSASVNYSVAWLDSYREQGTTSSNLKVDDRTSRALSARLQLAAAYKLNQRSEIELRTGVNSRHTDDDDVDVNLAGSSFRYGVSGDEDVTGGYAGLNVRFAASENLSLIADIEVGSASGDEDSTSGHLTLEYQF